LREEGLVALAGRLAQGHGPRAAAAAPPLRRGDARLARVAALLRASLAEPLSLATLAAEAGVTPEHLVRSFRAATGLPPRAWQLQLRLAEARRRLRTGDAVVGVALDLGFADQAHFHRLFRKNTGMTPGAYRRVARINR
jgi:AraC-like DNA-binding protein